MTQLFSRATQFLGRTTDAAINAIASKIEQVFNQVKAELDARPIVVALQTTTAQTAANLTETTLFTNTIEEGALAADGDYLFRLSFFGKKSNTNTVDLKLYFGGTLLQTVTSSSTGMVEVNEKIAIASGVWNSLSNHNGTVNFATTDYEVKLTATNHTAAAGDFVLQFASFELLAPLS